MKPIQARGATWFVPAELKTDQRIALEDGTEMIYATRRVQTDIDLDPPADVPSLFWPEVPDGTPVVSGDGKSSGLEWRDGKVVLRELPKP
jgi:hypothetical protein